MKASKPQKGQARSGESPQPKAAPAQPAPPRPPVEDESEDKYIAQRLMRVKNIIVFETWMVAILSVILMFVLPLSVPIYTYFALKPDQTVIRMVGLNMPNMTNHAITSWATTSVTEVMTVGFGDIDTKLPKQKFRFTDHGWDAYITAFVNAGMEKKFKQNQLVLTTVPSDTPVIIGQGINEEGVYQWNLQVPIIMTYATNNNTTRPQRHIIALQIVRVPAEEDAVGIAIQSWNIL